MRLTVDTLDDALLGLYGELLANGQRVTASRGDCSEFTGVLIEIRQPRARLSRSQTRGKVFSALGELLWYLTRDNQLGFIEPYIPAYREESEDGATVYGGYGPRFFQQRNHDQVRNIIELLTKRPTSRKAVVQVFNAEDIAAQHNEIPCTTTLQFLIRDELLHLIVTMRSNDAYLGLPHDVFCFTMLQEIIARELGREIGPYKHFVGSMHLYDWSRKLAEQFVGEGYQSRVEMPVMPSGNPWPSIEALLKAETRIRGGEKLDADQLALDPYWRDLVRMLQIFFSTDNHEIERLRDLVSFSRYRPYIISRLNRSGH